MRTAPIWEAMTPHIRPEKDGWSVQYHGMRAWWADHPAAQVADPALAWERLLEEAGSA